MTVCLFSSDGFRCLYFSEIPSKADFKRGSLNSKFVKINPLFSKNPKCCRLQLFFDELEVTNTLGPKTKKTWARYVLLSNFKFNPIRKILNYPTFSLLLLSIVRGERGLTGPDLSLNKILQIVSELLKNGGIILCLSLP